MRGQGESVGASTDERDIKVFRCDLLFHLVQRNKPSVKLVAVRTKALDGRNQFECKLR